jgi:hypothetical protein
VSEQPTFYLPWRQEWRQFTAEKHIFDTGVWMEIDSVKDVARKPKASRELFEDWQKLTWLCWHDGLVGWFCAVEKDNHRMERILKAWGGKVFQEDETFRYYYRHTVEPPEVIDFEEFHRRVKQVEEAACQA